MDRDDFTLHRTVPSGCQGSVPVCLASSIPKTEEWKVYDLPDKENQIPYALNIDPKGNVWICGTGCDSLLRFDPKTEKLVEFRMPSRVTYTREIEFDADGNVWTCNSNGPARHTERGFGSIIKLELIAGENESPALGEMRCRVHQSCMVGTALPLVSGLPLRRRRHQLEGEPSVNRGISEQVADQPRETGAPRRWLPHACCSARLCHRQQRSNRAFADDVAVVCRRGHVRRSAAGAPSDSVAGQGRQAERLPPASR